MAAISASLVKELRDQTGAGMMDCKRALEETGGDLEAARKLLREKGMARPRSAPAARRPRARSAIGSPTTAARHDGRRRLRDRAGLEQRGVPRLREGGARRGRRTGGRRRGELEDERVELSGKLGENIVVAGAGPLRGGGRRRHRRLRRIRRRTSSACSSSCEAATPSSRGKVAMHIARLAAPQWIGRDDVPEETIDARARDLRELGRGPVEAGAGA